MAAAEEEAIIRTRLLNQVSVSRGEPPFKRLTKRFIQLCEEGEKGSEEALQQAYEALLREISLLEMQNEKQSAILLANERERQSYTERQQELDNQISQTGQDIANKKLELEEARIIRQQNEEYEVLRQLVVQHPSRASTQQEMDRVKEAISKITAEGNRLAATMQRRRRQFALFFHVIEELQRDVDDPFSDLASMGELLASGDISALAPQQMELDP